ncbi:MAG: PQQ-dependent sugar dehydrogenase [Bacteroidota bacterium]
MIKLIRYSPAFYLMTFFILSCTHDDELQINQDTETTYELVNEALTISNYSSYCGGCHGRNLETFIERKWVYGNNVEAISDIIRSGTENGMPGYESTFTAQEISDLANYILRETEGKTLEDVRNDRPGLSGVFTSNDLNFQTEIIATDIGGSSGQPFGLTQLPDGDFLVTERRSRSLFRVTPSGTVTSVSGLPQVVFNENSQEGMLDVVLDPDFAGTNRIYFSYARPNPDERYEKSTAVASAVIAGNVLSQVEEIFIAHPYTEASGHYGSRLQFDRAGFLYITVGDRNNREEFPQQFGNSNGKIHRIMANGQIPTDNPYYDQGGVNRSIYAIGIRNPQGLTIHPSTGEIWSGEHGPQGGDEINVIGAGRNYGWPVITYGEEYGGGQIGVGTAQEGMEQPVVYWTPSIAPCGMTFITSNFYGAWQNDLFVGTLAGNHLRRLVMNGSEVVGQEVLLEGVGRIRDVHQGSDGFMYILIDAPGRLIRILPVQ